MPEPASAFAYPALVIDGSSSCFFSGVLGSDGSWLAYRKATEPALESLFKTVEQVLSEAGLELDNIESYVYCEGPGSLLGLRLCAMAVETWTRLQHARKQLYVYNSLQLVAAELLHQSEIKTDALLISDWKKGTWNSLRIHPGSLQAVGAISSTDLAEWQGPLYHLPARKGWQDPPENAVEVSYKPESLAELPELSGLIQPTEEVKLYRSGLNTFQKWTPERHRANPALK